MNKMGRKMGVVALFIALIIGCWTVAYGVTPPTGFTISAGSTNPKTQVRFQFDALDSLTQANADTVTIRNQTNETIYLQLGYIPTAAFDTTLTGFAPNTTVGPLYVSVDSADVRTSGPDTLSHTTDWIDFDWDTQARDSRVLSRLGQRMPRATSHHAGGLDTLTIALSDSSDSDSTIVFTPWPRTNVTVTAAGDTVKANVIRYAGSCEEATGVFRVSAVDTLSFTAAGTKHFASDTALPAAQHFYLKFEGVDGGGAMTFTPLLNRTRY
jgi:hypothetical protein